MRLRSALALWAFVASLVLVASTSVVQAAAVKSVDVLRYTAPDGETYFALPLVAPAKAAKTSSSRDVVILVDTSASQTGSHRVQALAVLDDVLASLGSSDRVQLFAVDVQATALTDDWSLAGSETIRQAVTRLRRRAPLGATRLVPALDAATRALAGKRPGSVLYIGDGMSSAELVNADDFKQVLARFRNRHVSIHSYGVGPRLDLQVLGVMAQQTGGTVVVDRGRKTDENGLGRRIATAIHAPVTYPAKVVVPEGITLLPSQPLPLRSDRQTIYVGRGSSRRERPFRDGWPARTATRTSSGGSDGCRPKPATPSWPCCFAVPSRPMDSPWRWPAVGCSRRRGTNLTRILTDCSARANRP